MSNLTIRKPERKPQCAQSPHIGVGRLNTAVNDPGGGRTTIGQQSPLLILESAEQACVRSTIRSTPLALRTAAGLSDEFTVPLCRVHHRDVHQVGNEQAWWPAAGIDHSTLPKSSGIGRV